MSQKHRARRHGDHAAHSCIASVKNDLEPARSRRSCLPCGSRRCPPAALPNVRDYAQGSPISRCAASLIESVRTSSTSPMKRRTTIRRRPRSKLPKKALCRLSRIQQIRRKARSISPPKACRRTIVLAEKAQAPRRPHQRHRRRVSPTSTTLLGGLQPSDLIIIAGRPGMGKSSLALNMAFNATAPRLRRRRGP